MLVFSSQSPISSRNSLRIPLRRLERTNQEKQSLISLLNTHHSQLTYPSFLQLDSSISLKNFANTQFVGEVGIGSPPQWLDVIFDTGSSNFFINSKLCDSASCLSRPSYDNDKSFTFEKVGFLLEVQFGTGLITGVISEDIVSIAGVELTHQRFAEVTDEEGDVFYDAKFNGILGLAFDSMAAFGTVPIFDNIIQEHQLNWNVFSFFYSLDASEDSEITLGDINPSKFTGEITWVPIIKDLMNYWLIEVDDILLGHKSLNFCPHKCKAAIDTGTTLLSAPSKNLDTLFDELTEDCKHFKKYPDLVFVIQGKKFAISPENYILTNNDETFDDPGRHSDEFLECSLGFMAIDVPEPNGPLWVLGDIFLSTYYSVFDRDNLAIGLAKAKHHYN